MKFAKLLALLSVGFLPSFICETLNEDLIPNPAFGRDKVHFRPFGQSRKAHEFLEAHFSMPLAIRVLRTGRMTRDSCADEYVGFRYISKKNLSSFFTDYRVCEYPFDTTINTDNFEIESKVICGDANHWIRLDCRYKDKTNRSSSPFFASRMSQPPGSIRAGSNKLTDWMGSTAGGKHFNQRIRCNKPSVQNELEECRALLGKFITLEKAMCDAENCEKPQQENKGDQEKAEGEGAQAAETTEKKEGEEGQGLSTTTIALIAGGGLLAVGVGIAMVKFLGGRKAADAVSEGGESSGGRSANRRAGRSRRKHAGSSNEPLLDENAQGDSVNVEEIEPDAESGPNGQQQ